MSTNLKDLQAKLDLLRSRHTPRLNSTLAVSSSRVVPDTVISPFASPKTTTKTALSSEVQLKEKSGEISGLQLRITDMTQQIHEQNEKIEKLEMQRSILDTTIISNSEKFTKVESRYKEQIDGLMSQLEALRKDDSIKNHEQSMLSTKIEDLHLQIRLKDEDLQQARHLSSVLSDERDTLRQQLLSFEKDKTSAMETVDKRHVTEMHEMEQKIVDLQTQNQIITLQLADSKQQLEQTVSLLKTKENSLLNLESSVQEIRNLHEDQLASKDVLVTSLQEKLDDLSSKYAEALKKQVATQSISQDRDKRFGEERVELTSRVASLQEENVKMRENFEREIEKTKLHYEDLLMSNSENLKENIESFRSTKMNNAELIGQLNEEISSLKREKQNAATLHANQLKAVESKLQNYRNELTSLVEEKSDLIESHTAQHKVLERELKTTMDDNSELTAENQRLMADLNEMNMSYDELETSFIQLEQLLQAQDEEAQSLLQTSADKLKEATAQLEKSEVNLATRDKDLARVKEEVHNLRLKLSDERSMIAKLESGHKSELEQMRRDKIAAVCQVEEMMQKISELRSSQSATENERNTFESEKITLAKEVADLEAVIVDKDILSEEEAEKWAKSKAEMSDVIDRLDRDKCELEEKLSAMEIDLISEKQLVDRLKAKYKDEIDSLLVTIAEKDEVVKERISAIGELESRVAELRGEISDKERTIVEKEDEITQKALEIQTILSSGDSTVAKHAEEVQALDKQISDLISEVQHRDGEIADYGNTVSLLKETISLKIDEITQLERDADEAREASTEQLTERDNRIGEIMDSLQETTESLVSAQEKIQQANGQVHTLNKIVQNSKQAIEERDERILHLKDMLRDMHTDMTALSVDTVAKVLSEKNERMDQLEAQLMTMRKQVAGAKAFVSSIISHTDSSLKSYCKTIVTKNDNITRLEKTIEDHLAQIDALNASLADARSEINNYNGINNDLVKTIEQRDHRIRELENTIDSYSSQLGDGEDAKSKLNEELRLTESQVRMLRSENVELNDKIRSISQQAKESASAHQESLDELMKQNSAIKDELAETIDVRDVYNQTVKELELQLADYKTDVKKLKAKILTAEKLHLDENGGVIREKELLDAELRTLRESFATQEADLSNIRTQMIFAEEQLADLKNTKQEKEHVEEKLSALQMKFEELSKLNGELDSRSSVAEDRLKSNNDAMELMRINETAMKDEIYYLKGKKTELMIEISKLKKLEEALSTQKGDMLTLRRKLETNLAENNSFTDEIASLSAEKFKHERTIKELTKKITELENDTTVMELTDQLDVLKTAVEDGAQKTNSLELSLTEMTNAKVAAEDEAVQREKDLNGLKATHEALTVQLNECHALIAKLRNNQTPELGLSGAEHAELDRLRRVELAYANEVDVLKEKCATLTAFIQNMEQTV
ncbi:hypothetical protein PCE1_004092 [Barthelona sp. PCE]